VKIAFASSRVVRRAFELERQHVEQHLRIGIGVDVTEVELEELAFQRLAVRQVAVVRKRDAERRVDVERLRLELGRRARRWDTGNGRCRGCP
jgi:hypothetical protein